MVGFNIGAGQRERALRAAWIGAAIAAGLAGVLPTEFARRFRGVAGFRNVLVHGYLGVDLARVHELLNSGLDDFVAFARHVERYLERS